MAEPQKIVECEECGHATRVSDADAEALREALRLLAESPKDLPTWARHIARAALAKHRLSEGMRDRSAVVGASAQHDQSLPLAESAPPRCPTCGSDNPNVCSPGYPAHPHNHTGRPPCCPDPFHDAEADEKLVLARDAEALREELKEAEKERDEWAADQATVSSECEALREERDAYESDYRRAKAALIDVTARADALREALREIVAMEENRPPDHSPIPTGVMKIARAALSEQESYEDGVARKITEQALSEQEPDTPHGPIGPWRDDG